MSLPRRSELTDALQIGAAQVWRAYPSVATPNHHDANAFISAKEQLHGTVWSELWDEVRSDVTSLIYQKWNDDKPLSFRAGMAIGLQIIDESHFFSKDGLSIVHQKLSDIAIEHATHNAAMVRERLFEYALQGFDVIKPQFLPAAASVPPDQIIVPEGNRNTDFELGVGMVLHAALDSTSVAAAPRRLLLPNA
jgi:hypothetical protein